MNLTIAHNAVNAKVTATGTRETPREIKLLLHEALSYKVDGAEHTGAFKSHQWNGRSSFLDYEPGTFPTGLVGLVMAKLKEAGHQVQLARRPFPAPLGPVNPKVDDFPEDPRYDYQPQVVDCVLRHGQIIAHIATGGGKSRVCKLVYKRIGRMTLFLTTRGILMHQMARAVRRDLKERVGVMGDDEWNIVEGGFNVGMVQTFAARLEVTDFQIEFDRLVEDLRKKEDKARADLKARLTRQKVEPGEIAKALGELMERQEGERPADADVRAKASERANRQIDRRRDTLELLEKFELVVLEEAHESSGNSFYDIMRACKNAHYRLSLTATPFMKDSEEANMRLMACSGPVAIKVSEKLLIDRGILARPFFRFARVTDQMPEGDVEVKTKDGPVLRRFKLFKTTPWPKCYEIAVAGGIVRNRIVVGDCLRARNYGLSVIVLCQRGFHGLLLQRLLTEAGLRANFIRGEHSQEEREAGLNALAGGRIDVLIGSTILDVGVDVPSVGWIINASGGKAEVATRQRYGRGLREKKNGLPNVAFITEFNDWQNDTLRGHSLERRRIIEETPGFVEGIVDDFPFEALGFVKKAA